MPIITFDGPNKIIDIGYDASTTEVTVPGIYSRWKEWVQAGNAGYLRAFDLSVGGNPLGAGVNIDGYYFLRNDLGWRIRAADQDHILIINGQLFGFATGTAVYLNRAGRTITYREVQSSRSQVVNPAADTVSASGSFQGRVWVNPDSVHSGTDFPKGTSVEPVDNISDAVVIANIYGLREIYILGSLTVLENVSGLSLTGADTGVVLTVDAGANVLNTTFDGVDVEGYFDGPSRIRNGTINEILDGFVGDIDDCHITSGIKCIGDVNLHRCSSGVAWQGGAYLDMQGGVYACQVREYSGTIEVMGMVAGSTMTVDLSAGRVIINADCTGGSIKVRGVGEPIEDNSGGAVTIDEDGFMYSAKTVNALTGHIWAS